MDASEHPLSPCIGPILTIPLGGNSRHADAVSSCTVLCEGVSRTVENRLMRGKETQTKQRPGPSRVSGPGLGLVRLEGFEPTTRGLRIRCSAS